MNTKALRQKVLDLAIHGKLVPQNPKDESATVLLEKIRAEKTEKIKKGELKADKKDSFIFVGSDKRHYEQFADGTVKDIEDEIPFEVPEGWAWCRVKQFSLDMADGPFGSNLKAEHYTNNKEARIIQLSNIGEYGWREKNTKYTTFKHAKNYIARSIVEPGNVVIAKMMPAGRAIICPNHEKMYVLSSDAVKLVPTRLINLNYLLNAINSPFFRASVTDNVQGTTRLRTSISKLRECLFPLPPLTEQSLIVKTVEKAISQIDVLDQNKEELETAIKQAKNKILDLAIHGKLVPQDPNDEPAEELLKRIATSDNRPYEKVDEEPFEIPDTWKWVKLGFIVDILDSKRKPITKSDRKSGIYPYYGATCLQDYVSDYLFDEDLLLLGEDGAKWGKGEISAFCISGKTWVNNHAHVLRPLHKISMQYLCYTLNILDLTPFVTGTTVPKLNQLNMAQILIPLPPLSEQERIVTKIENIMFSLDKIVSNLI